MIAEEIMMYVWFFFVNNCLKEQKDRRRRWHHFEGLSSMDLRWVTEFLCQQDLEATKEDTTALPASFLGACNECRASIPYKNLLLFKLNSCFFGKTSHYFFQISVILWDFRKSKSSKKTYLFVFEKTSDDFHFQIHPLWETSDTYLLTIGCMLGGTPGFAESSRRGGGIGEICETLSM